MRIVIVGAVAAGTTAATKIRRNDPDADIVLYDRDDAISYSGCGLPYFIGGEVGYDEIVPRGPAWFAERYGIDVRPRHDVIAVDPERRTVVVRDLATGAETVDTYDTLILATGAAPVMPDLPGIGATGVLPLRAPHDARAVRAHLEAVDVTEAVIVGAGFIGLEMAEQLTGLGIATTLVERAPHVLPPLDADVAAEVAAGLRRNGVTVHEGCRATALLGDPVRAVRLDTGAELPAQLVVMSIGVRPVTDLARQAGVRLGESGAIAVDQHLATSVPGILAVGDVAESFDLITGRPVWRPLGTTANKMGRIAGDALTGGRLAHRGILGTGIVRAFDQTIALTGLSEHAAVGAGFDVVAVRSTRPDRSTYLGGTDLLLKLVADRSTGRVLGAQAVGQQGVDKRIDVLATAITFGARVEDLFHLDLAYSPPYSTTKDPVHYAGMALTNRLDAPLR